MRELWFGPRSRPHVALPTADDPAEVLEGIGSSYITYDWSACAMLIVMHYFAGAPFKRLESLHNGWGVPMPDANQWEIIDACSAFLPPLLRAIEQHGIHNAVSLRVDDTGSEVISLRRQIQAEIAAIRSIGKSTKDVVAYLTHCLRHHEDLAHRLEHYLPWIYRGRQSD